MAYIEIKTIKGRRYKYLRKTVRDGKRMKHITLKYLGPVDPVYGVGKRHKSNASIYVLKLSNDELTVLKRATKSNNAFVRDRARSILLSSDHLYAKQIAEKIGCEVRKVRNAIKAFNLNGLDALQKGKSKGAPPKFTAITRKIILMHFSKKPRSYGYHFTTWTLPRFQHHLVDYNVVNSISVERLRQILIAAGAKLKRSKRWQYSPDKKFEEKKTSN